MELIFQSHPDVVIGGNTFRNVATILQFEDTPLLEVGKFEPAGYSTRFPIYHNDGTKLAVVSGSQIHLTAQGEKAGINRRCEPNLTVCEVAGKPILELRRQGATALHGWAELYAPEGVLIRAYDSGASGLLRGGGDILVVGNMVMKDSVFDGHTIGIHFLRTGIGLGVGPGTLHIGYLGPSGGIPPMLRRSP